jgi:hypothetical protein
MQNPFHMHPSPSTQTKAQPARKWLRVAEAIEYSGWGRSTFYKVLNDGGIKTAMVCQKGNTKGIRMVSVDSIDSYISSFAGV